MDQERKLSIDIFQDPNVIINKMSFDGSAFLDPHSDSNTELAKSLLEGSDFEKNEDQLHPHLQIANSKPLTIFLLINTMIGSGILNQPFVFRTAGVLGGLIGFVFAAAMTWMGLVLLTSAGIHAGVYEYGGLAKKALGRTGEILIEVSIIIGCFGALLGYILVVGSTLSDLLISWGCNSIVCEFNLTTVLSVAIFVFPVCLYRHYGHLAIIAVFSIFAIVCVLLLVLIGGPIKGSQHPVSGPLNLFNLGGTARSLGSIIFALSCASANFQAYITTNKKHQNLVSWKKILLLAVGIGSFMCASMGLAGYLSFRGETDGNILSNFSGHGFDFFKLLVAIHLIFYIPVNFIIMRYSIIKLALNMKSEAMAWTSNAALSVILLTITTLMVLLFSFVGLNSGEAFALILDLTGGVASSLSSFILPAMIFMKVAPQGDPYLPLAKFNFCMGLVLVVVVVTETILPFAS